MIRLYFCVSTLFLLLASSCSDSKEISSYTVLRKDFQHILQIEGLVESIQTTSISSKTGGIIAFLIEDGVYVEEGDLLCILENSEMQTWYDQQLQNLDAGQANLEKTKANLNLQYALLEAQVKTNEAETQIAQLDSLQLRFSSPTQRKIRELELQKTAIEKGKYAKKIKALPIIHQSEIKKIELEIQRFTNTIVSIKQDLDGLIIKSPKRGVVIRSISPMTELKFKIGDNCWRTIPILNIPEMEIMKVKMLATEAEYKSMNINDSVYFTFNAIENNVAWGKIKTKMPIGQAYKQGSKVKFFDIEASIDSVISMPEPGFSANCSIILKHIKDTISVPQITVFEKDSMKVVFVELNRGYEMREVKLGESSPKEIIITKGLRANEVIAMRRPPESDINKRTILSDSLKTK